MIEIKYSNGSIIRANYINSSSYKILNGTRQLELINISSWKPVETVKVTLNEDTKRAVYLYQRLINGRLNLYLNNIKDEHNTTVSNT